MISNVSLPSATLLQASAQQRTSLPLSDEMAFLNDALHRFVGGGIYLFAGAPGSGKSLLSAQIALEMGKRQIPSLVIMTEQSPACLKETAVRITGDWDRKLAKQAMSHVSADDRVYDVQALPAWVTRAVLSPSGQYHGAQLVIMDSIQGHGLSAAATKSYAKVLEAARLLADAGITVILISHVTKRGDVAGPKSLEHGVDAAIVLRRAMQYTMLNVRKNRFGPINQRMIPLVIDPVTTRLSMAPHTQATPGAARTFAGAGTGIMQIQAAVSVPADGRSGRLTAPGLPRREIEQLVDCIAQVDRLDVSDLDFRIQCRLPGCGRYSTYYGLPLCMALIGSYARREIPESYIYMGEVDLFKKILPVPFDVIQDLVDAVDQGDIATPITVFASPMSVVDLPKNHSKIRVVPCNTLEDAIFQTWPEMR